MFKMKVIFSSCQSAKIFIICSSDLNMKLVCSTTILSKWLLERKRLLWSWHKLLLMNGVYRTFSTRTIWTGGKKNEKLNLSLKKLWNWMMLSSGSQLHCKWLGSIWSPSSTSFLISTKELISRNITVSMSSFSNLVVFML